MVALDVGTHTIKSALAEIYDRDEISVLGLSVLPSRGMKKGHVVDIEGAARAMDESLNDLERLTGVEILSASLGFSGSSITTINNHTVVAVGNPSYEITTDDKNRVLQSARNVALPPDKGIVQIVERQYVIDGYDGVRDPVGMVGSRLEAEITIIIAASAAMQNLQRSAGRINLIVNNIVFNPLLEAGVVLRPMEGEMGVALVDVGGGTIDVSVFEADSLAFSSVLPLGSEYITKDLAIILKTSLEEAASIKEQSGRNGMGQLDQEVSFTLAGQQGKESRQVSQQMVAEIITARVSEMAELVYAELGQAGYLNKLPAGVVLTGGGAELPGMVEIFEQYFELPVRLGLPDNIKGLAAEYNRPGNAAVLGGLLFAARHHDFRTEPRKGISILVDRMGAWYRDFFR